MIGIVLDVKERDEISNKTWDIYDVIEKLYQYTDEDDKCPVSEDDFQDVFNNLSTIRDILGEDR